MRWSRVAWSALSGAALALLSVSAHADEEDIHLHLEAHEGCPSRETFVAQVEARTTKARWVDSPDNVRAFEVILTRVGNQTIGRLVIFDASGTASEPREVKADNCTSVAGALALITALAIDPQASLTAKPPPPPPPTTTTTTKPVPAPKPAPPPPPPTPPSPEPRGSKPDDARWRWSLGARLDAMSGLGSKLAAVLPLFVDVTRFGDGVLSPSFRVALAWMPDRHVAIPQGAADFWRLSGQLSGCPIALPLADTVHVRPCVEFDAGMLTAQGVDVDGSQTDTSPWLTAGASGRLQLHPLEWVLIEIQGAFAVPLVRPSYQVQGGSSRFEVVELDSVVGSFGGGIGARFP